MKKLLPLLMIIMIMLPSCRIQSGNGGVALPETEPALSALSDEAVAYDGTTAAQAEASSTQEQSSDSAVSLTMIVTTTAASITRAVTTTKSQMTAAATTVTKAPATAAPTKPTSTTAAKPTAASNEMRGIWLSYYEFPSAQGKTKEEFAASADTVFKNIKAFGLNTAFVHVRAFSDSFYPSSIFPWSKYVTGTQGKSPGYDTLAIMISSAKKYGISFHAWINPFRVATDRDYTKLAPSNPARKIIESGNAQGEICILPNGIYYCPASTAMHSLILSGVKEILQNYDVDGIHIDDYFYPSESAAVDSLQYKKYTESGGKLSLAAWRKGVVNSFVSALYSTVKSFGATKTVSISPAGNMSDNNSKNFADAAAWMSKSGYADLIIPQIYFGFNHPTVPFRSTADLWAKMKTNGNVRLVCGLAAYKVGKKDENAGSAANEWVNNTDMLKRQLDYIRQNGKYTGFVLFSYSNVFGTNSAAMKSELASFKTLL